MGIFYFNMLQLYKYTHCVYPHAIYGVYPFLSIYATMLIINKIR